LNILQELKKLPRQHQDVLDSTFDKPLQA